MDNTNSANADFRLTQTTFSTRCHQNTSVNTDCIAVGTPQLRPVGRQLFTDASYYNYTLAFLTGHLDSGYEMQADFILSPASACKSHEVGSGSG